MLVRPGPDQVSDGLFLRGERPGWGGPRSAPGPPPQHPGLLAVPGRPAALRQLQGLSEQGSGQGGLGLAEQKATLLHERLGPRQGGRRIVEAHGPGKAGRGAGWIAMALGQRRPSAGQDGPGPLRR